ncbi:MAG: hypothetical protein H6735_32350 [Alphaproteobacteria bacterium]|nr:hypothetical protein [Alphaproteobacteria bacterium]
MRGSWWCLLLAVACKKGDGDVTTEDTGPVYKDYPLAGDVVLDSVRINQGSERVLYLGPGVIGGGNYPPPVIAARPGRLTVEFSALDEALVEERDIAVVLSLSSGTELAAVGHLVPVESVFGGRPKVEFELPGSVLRAGMSMTVELHEAQNAATGTYTDETVWTSAEAGLDVVSSERVEVHLIPVMIQASTLAPDTTPTRVQEVADRMMSMYPTTGVDVIVEPSITWPNPIGPMTGWEALLGEISRMRTAANVPPNAYFYGVFKPAPSEAEFCAAGCILGLSNLPTSPSDDWAKSSIGVGFQEGDVMVETMLHEVGHAHGRLHSPCGGAAGPDPRYPYANATIGVEGWDADREVSFGSSDAFDVMGYCFPIWISDYTFTALYDRIDGVMARRSGQPTDWLLASVDGEGRVEPVGEVTQGPIPSDDVRTFEVLDDEDRVVDEVDGYFVPFDHLPGGLTLLPPDVGERLRLRQR